MQCMYDCHKDEISGVRDVCKMKLQTQNLPILQLKRGIKVMMTFDLKEEHGSKYTAQQYRLWANMLQIGTWKDNDYRP